MFIKIMFKLANFWNCSILFLVICVNFSNTEITGSCLECDSNVNPNCSIRPDTIKDYCRSSRGCVTLINDDHHTVRKCFTDNESDCKQCIKCDGVNCNSEIFPLNRIKCHQCSGSNCLNLTVSDIELPCLKFIENDKCFTYVFNESNAVRGCESDKNEDCFESLDVCKICQGNGCNNQPSTYIVSCYDCMSLSHTECQRRDSPSLSEKCKITWKIPKCSYHQLLGREGKCHTAIVQDVVIRSCEPLKPSPVNSDVFLNCTGDLCNSACIEDRKCIQCNSNDTKCVEESGLEAFNKICPEYTVGCYRCENIDETETVRGCGHTRLPWSELQVCTTCNEDGCYAKKPPRGCYKCDSRTNPLCSNLITDSEVARSLHLCTKHDDQCVTLLTEDGYTLRGCLNETLEQEQDCSDNHTNCIKCNSHYCNTDVIPKNRIRCYQCDGATNFKCNMEQVFLPGTECARYVPNDKCYTFAWPDESMVRGCQSDENINSENCEKLKGNKCAKCNTSSCNKLPSKAVPTLKCHKCEADNVKCSWSYDETVHCRRNFHYWEEESCFIYKHKNGSVTRGCTLDSEICSNAADPNCKKFEGDYSNGKTTVIQNCYACQSNTAGEENCADNPKKIKPIACKNEFISYENRGCFKYVKDEKITRGCVADLSKDDRKQCEQDGVCKICIPDNCNKSAFKKVSLAVVLSISFFWTFSYLQ